MEDNKLTPSEMENRIKELEKLNQDKDIWVNAYKRENDDLKRKNKELRIRLRIATANTRT